MYSKETVAKLKEMGCEGFTVKMITNAKDHSTVMQLTKAEHKPCRLHVSRFPQDTRK